MDKRLKKDAIGFSDGLRIALASTAPAGRPAPPGLLEEPQPAEAAL